MCGMTNEELIEYLKYSIADCDKNKEEYAETNHDLSKVFEGMAEAYADIYKRIPKATDMQPCKHQIKCFKFWLDNKNCKTCKSYEPIKDNCEGCKYYKNANLAK